MPKLIRLLPWLIATTISLGSGVANISINIVGTVAGTQPFAATLEVDSNYLFTTGSGTVTDFTFDIYQNPQPVYYVSLQHITPTSATFCKPEDLRCVITATADLSNDQLSVSITSSACCDTLRTLNFSDDTYFMLTAPYPPDGQTSLFAFDDPRLTQSSFYQQNYSTGAGVIFGIEGALTVSSTPEPSLYFLLGTGLVGLGCKRRQVAGLVSSRAKRKS